MPIAAALLSYFAGPCRQDLPVDMSAADTAIGSSLDEEMQAQQLLVEEQDSEGSQGSVKHKDPAAVAAAVRKQVWDRQAAGAMVFDMGLVCV
jgi:hypothetical protein